MALGRRDACFLAAVDQALAYGKGGYHSPDFMEAVTDWLVVDNQDVSAPHLSRIADNIISRIRSQAFESYVSEAGDLLDREGSRTKGFAMGMAQWIEKEAKRLNKKFGDPIASSVYLVIRGLVLIIVTSTLFLLSLLSKCPSGSEIWKTRWCIRALGIRRTMWRRLLRCTERLKRSSIWPMRLRGEWSCLQSQD